MFFVKIINNQQKSKHLKLFLSALLSYLGICGVDNGRRITANSLIGLHTARRCRWAKLVYVISFILITFLKT